MIACAEEAGESEGTPAAVTPPAATPPNLVLVVIDTLRADHVGAYGYPRATSPNLDRLAAEGVLFTNASAPSSWTKPSIGSLFTSRLPSEHGAVTFDRQLSKTLPTLAELLQGAGYRTLGVSANFVHVTRHTGMARGFQGWSSKGVDVSGEDEDPAVWRTKILGKEILLREKRSNEVNRAVFRRLKGPARGPLFLYVHYMDPHSPYTPPELLRKRFAPYAEGDLASATTDYILELSKSAGEVEPAERQRLVDLYDAEIAAADVGFGGLRKVLESRGFWNNTVIAIVSDHGEEFEDHGGWFHGLTLHREMVSIPFVMLDARRPAGGVQSDEPVDLLDIPTTFLALAGVEAPADMRGRVLLSDGAAKPRDVVAELHPDTWLEAHRREGLQRLALQRWPWKAILGQDGARSFYRLDDDPREERPLEDADTPPDLASALTALEESLPSAEAVSSPEPLSPEYLEQLRSLGYVD